MIGVIPTIMLFVVLTIMLANLWLIVEPQRAL